jgi:biotin carboxyl carrier protein
MAEAKTDEVAKLKEALEAAEARADAAESKAETAELRAEAAEQAAKDTGKAAAPVKKKFVLTEAGSHVATMRGYAKGSIVEEGDPVPEGIPVSDEWMAKAKKKKRDEDDDE